MVLEAFLFPDTTARLVDAGPAVGLIARPPMQRKRLLF